MTAAPIPCLPGVSVAFVRDWMTVYGGADRTMAAALELFPAAPIHSLVYQPEHFQDTSIARHRVETSFLQRWPGSRSRHRGYLPLMPLAIEQFDLRGYDLVVSMSHAVAKGVLTRADQLHISYCFTPPRYAWDLYFEHLGRVGARGWASRCLLHYLRIWDQASTGRVDVLVASSRTVARRIWKTYRRHAEVVYPPVDVDRFQADEPRDDYYLTVSRLVPYKQVPLMAEAFNRLKRRLVVIGEGPDRAGVERAGGVWVELLGHQPDAVVRDHLQRCKAFVFAADEDFGIAPIEAQAAGAAVIAYGRGGGDRNGDREPDRAVLRRAAGRVRGRGGRAIRGDRRPLPPGADPAHHPSVQPPAIPAAVGSADRPRMGPLPEPCITRAPRATVSGQLMRGRR